MARLVYIIHVLPTGLSDGLAVLPNDYVEMNVGTLDFEVVNMTDQPDHLLVHACCRPADSSTKLRLPFSKSFRLLNMAYKAFPKVDGKLCVYMYFHLCFHYLLWSESIMFYITLSVLSNCPPDICPYVLYQVI